MSPANPSFSRKRPADAKNLRVDHDSESSQASGESSDSSKRARLRNNPDPFDSDDNDSDNTEASERRRTGLVNGHSLLTSNDGFKPGAIVRVKVENFVTYEKAEFFPGPHLNMVIGPNGTGKSSLVCAICLGLGYHPRHLGRASSVKEFVKHGKDVATIEIELQQTPRSSQNFTIRLQIFKEQGSQKWWLNGRDTTHKEIQKLMKTLHIQVDNLCQFLPQDRVVEFAACTPVGLLHETLRAAAPEYMLEWQAELKDLHAGLKTEQEKANSESELLKNLESRQQGLQADVDRLRERQEIETLVQDLKNARICAYYDESRKAAMVAKGQKKEAIDNLARLERESGPSLESVRNKEAYQSLVQDALEVRKGLFRQAEQSADALQKEIEKSKEKMQSLIDQIDAEEQGVDKTKKEILRSRQKIASLETQLSSKPVEFHPADWNTKIRAKEHDLRELESENMGLAQERQLLKDKARPKKDELAKISQEIKALDSREGRQLNFLRKTHPDTVTAIEWLRNNRDAFGNEVLEPSVLSCSIKDERYSDQVQAVLQIDDFTCFTVQSRNDYLKLSDQFYTKMGLSVSIRTCVAKLSQFRPPMDQQAARGLGFDGFVIDYIQGPEPVLAMLCAERKIHLAGVALRDVTTEQYESLVQGEVINTWACGRQIYRVVRRKEYGAAGLSVNNRLVQPGRFWKDQPMEATEKAALVARQSQLNFEFEELSKENQSVVDKLKRLEASRDEINQDIASLKQQKNELQTAHNIYQALPEKIESEKRTMARHEQGQEAAKQKILDLRISRDKSMVETCHISLRYKDAIRQALDAHGAVIEAHIRLIEAQSDVTGLNIKVQEIKQQLEEGKEALAQADAEVRKTKDVAIKAKEAAEAMLSEHNERRAVFTQLIEGKTAEELDSEVAAEEAKLELIHAVNPTVLRNYDRQAKEIEVLRAKMAASTEKLDKLKRQIAKIRAKWEPQLDELVAKIDRAFSANFERISCAGEVRVHKDDDFDQWALEIMVKFRENEALQQLNQHRQSGGERAVSTIFYLMALQSMAQSPFRVVDEINQGMDPRNERMVHERMVEIACREHSSQYFLITPKLLTGLRYDERMRVLCIASGEHMPQDGSKLDFTKCLAIQRELMAGA